MADGSGNTSGTVSLEYLHFIAIGRCVILSETVPGWNYVLFFEVTRQYFFIFWFNKSCIKVINLQYIYIYHLKLF